MVKSTGKLTQCIQRMARGCLYSSRILGGCTPGSPRFVQGYGRHVASKFRTRKFTDVDNNEPRMLQKLASNSAILH